MRSLTAKILKEKLKKKWIAEDFAKYLGCSETHFWNLLEKNFKGNFLRTVKADLDSNEQYKKHTNQDGRKTVSDTLVALAEDDFEIDTENEELSSEYEDFFELDETLEEIIEVPEETSLEDLILQKDELETSLNEFELQHKTVVAKRTAIKEQITKHNQELIRLQEIVLKNRAELSELSKELDETQNELNEANAKISDCKEKIFEVTNKIEELQKISIFVYDSGEIDFTSVAVEIPDSWNTHFDSLLEDELLESLTVKQLKSFAKVLALTKKLEDENHKFELTFENSTLEEYFYKK